MRKRTRPMKLPRVRTVLVPRRNIYGGVSLVMEDRWEWPTVK